MKQGRFLAKRPRFYPVASIFPTQAGVTGGVGFVAAEL